MSQQKSSLRKTLNDLSEEIRGEMVSLLNARLVDSIDLFTQIKQAHWNVKGPNFIALHELFDKVAEKVVEFSDTIAERAVQLGGTVFGTARIVSTSSSLKEYPLTIVSGHDHVNAVAEALAEFGKGARAAITIADERGDADTADLFTNVSREIDKQLWFVEAHLQAKE